MNDLMTISYDAVTTKNGQPVTTSLVVAKYFGKNHQHVLRDIRGFAESKSGLSKPFFDRNFVLRTYKIEGGKSSLRDAPMYELAFDGFMILVMGYEGEQAMIIKEAYINAFNQMAATLREAETHFTRKAKAALREKYPNMEPVRQRFKLSNQTVKRIASELGISESTVRRSLKGSLHWGLITEQQYQRDVVEHREFQAVLRRIRQERQLSLLLDEGHS